MIRRIDQISIAVRDLERAKTFFIEDLGGRELYSQPFPEQKYRWTLIELGTSCFIELVDPLEKDGFLHRFLETRGEGPHHITIHVDDIQKTVQTLEERRIPTFGFSESLPGWKEVLIHPKDAFGTLIQFAEFNPLDWIEPGYIPPSYQEFAPLPKLASGQNGIEIRRVQTAEGPQVEMRQDGQVIRIPPSHLGELLAALKQEQKEGAPSPE